MSNGKEVEHIEALKRAGYEPAYVWDAEPDEVDENHSHPFHTHLVILSGEIEVSLRGESRVLKSGDEIDIPAQAVHSAKAGSGGCRYIVAERHD